MDLLTRRVELRHPGVCLLHASAGMGKTTIARKLLQQLCERSGPLPIYLEFTKFRGAGELDDIVWRLMDILGLTASGLRPASLYWLIGSGAAVLILDGFDEFLDETGWDRAHRSLRTPLDSLRSTGLAMLTCRTNFLTTEAVAAVWAAGAVQYERYRIAPLEAADVLGIASSWARVVGHTNAVVQRIGKALLDASDPLLQITPAAYRVACSRRQ